MHAFLVVLDRWPLKDAAPAGRAVSQAIGGTPIDRAVMLRNCRGIAAERLDEPTARSIVAALASADCKAWAAPEDLVPRLPKALTARRLDPRGEVALLAQVRMTGPPDELPWNRILLAVPATWNEVKVALSKPAAKGRSMASTAMSIATTGGVGLLFDKKVGAEPGGRAESASSDAMLELVVAGPPLRRYHAFASRMDYSALGKTAEQGADNWQALLGVLRGRLRAEVTGGALIDRALAQGPLPAALQVSDANDLGRTTRWLMLRAAMRRLDARG